MNQSKIGQFIALCRKEKGMTQQELADKLGLTAKAISKWETGKGLPDVSLYEAICKELGITLNEFFAGERIDEKNALIKADENLEQIIKDYHKMKKNRNNLLALLCGVGILVGVYFVKMGLALGILIGIDVLGASESTFTDVRDYSKQHFIETYGGDLDSNLSVFPDVIHEEMSDVHYESAMSTGLFDSDGYIFLEYTLDDEDFSAEVKRLRELSQTIQNFDGDSYTNEILYAEGMYDYPAYITIDGFANTYEYALIDEKNNRIICVYIAYLQSSGFKHDEYLKKDKGAYEMEDTLSLFSMYNHTFNGGESYIEFDD